MIERKLFFEQTDSIGKIIICQMLLLLWFMVDV